jgi:hypothetical protein
MPWAYRGLAVALRELSDLEEMDKIVQTGLLHSPVDFGLNVEAARGAELRSEWHEAVGYWQTARSVVAVVGGPDESRLPMRCSSACSGRNLWLIW